MNKNIFIVGFMLFAIFFGAGNLIFPPKLGFLSGDQFWIAIAGFILTGVGLPLISVIVGAFDKHGYKGALTKIHPLFSLVFLSAIYLSIGPLFAIPRTGSTVYEMALLPFLGQSTGLSLFIFTLFYFGLALWLALNPSKMIERIGAILTPALILSILALVVASIFNLEKDPNLVMQTQASNATVFSNGVLEGYQTLDALAAVAFSVIVIGAIRAKNPNAENQLIKQTAFASIISAIALATIYVGIGWIGNNLNITPETLQQLEANKQDLGSYILNTAASISFGEYGRILLGVIVSLACLTTTIGLIVSVSEYFNEVYHKISYRTYAVIFAVVGIAIANQGLSAVISKSVPMLLMLYPISIVVMLLLLINRFLSLPVVVMRTSIAFVTVVSILSGLGLTTGLPLQEYSMEWFPFAVIGFVLGWIINGFVKPKA